MGKTINVIILILGIAMILYWLCLGICVRFGQSLMFLWPLAGGLCIARYFWWRHIYATGCYPPAVPILIARIALAALLALFLIVEGIILAGGMIRPADDAEYIVVLGARVNPDGPSGALRNRTQTAYEYLAAHPDARAVLSGGQGADEPISEARCMHDLLIDMGIAPDRLIIEDASKDTSENLQNSFALIPDGARAALVTNNFHMMRARALAKGMGRQVGGIPVATSAISLPHYLLREFAGVSYEFVRGNFAG